jgi:hypothetical protein
VVARSGQGFLNLRESFSPDILRPEQISFAPGKKRANSKNVRVPQTVQAADQTKFGYGSVQIHVGILTE